MDVIVRESAPKAIVLFGMLAIGKLPPPANDARCKECSLNEICQPQAVAEKAEQRALATGLFDIDD